MKTSFKEGEGREHFITEVVTMRFIIQHSRTTITRYGAAPNKTVRQDDESLKQQFRRYEQTSTHDEVRVLRFDSEGKVVRS